MKRTYKPGSFLRVDDRTGFTVRAEKTRKEWTGLIVDKKVWEGRHPQELVRGRADRQTVMDARPASPNSYYGPFYIALDESVLAGTSFIPLEHTNGLTGGDSIGIVLDDGTIHFATIVSITTGVGVVLSSPLPSSASSGNLLVDYGVLNGGVSAVVVGSPMGLLLILTKAA